MFQTPDLQKLDIDAIQREIEAGYICQQQHPEAPLRILNYSQLTQFDWRWNAETMQCRGLVVDQHWQVLARPFPKFFSVEQLNGIVPIEPFEAYEMLDGSLGILYRINGLPRIATRGSFTSTQAEQATRIYRRNYSHIELDDSLTDLFEIIFPENRIVVDYGDTEELILLAVIETSTGIEQPLPEIGFPIVKRYDGVLDFDELMAMQDKPREGFVVRFQSGQRVKIKFDEYKRLHKLLTGVSHQQSGKLYELGMIYQKLSNAFRMSSLNGSSRPRANYDQSLRRSNQQLEAKYQQVARAGRSPRKSTSANIQVSYSP